MIEIEAQQGGGMCPQSILQGSSYAAVRRLQATVKDGKLFVRGEVSSFYERQVAEHAVRPVFLGGNLEFVSEIDVLVRGTQA